jgi:hypothetical protein
VGKISMTTTESDWREVEGLKFAFKTTIDQSIQKVEIQVESVQLNPETPEGTFSLPPQVQKMVDKKKAAEEAAEPAEGGAVAEPPGGGGR